MTANSTNRETARDALATLLNAAMVGTGKPGQQVTNYEKGQITSAPLTQVVSGGSRRRQHGKNSEKWANQFRLLIRNFVPDADASVSWTEQNVEDRLDWMEQVTANVIADNRGTANWQYIDYEDVMTVIMPAKDNGSGKTYMVEEIPVIVTVYDA